MTYSGTPVTSGKDNKTGYTLFFAVLTAALVGLYAGGLNTITSLSMLGSTPIEVYLAFAIGALALVTVVLGGDASVVSAVAIIGTFMILTLNNPHPLQRYLTLAAVLFALGMYGMVASRNAVRVLMSIELMLNAVNLNLIAFSRYVDPVAAKGQIFAIFILTVAAAEAAVGLAIVLAIYRNTATVDMEKFDLLKW